MVGIETGRHGDSRLPVIVEPSAVPVEPAHGVEILEEVHVDLLRFALVHQQRHRDGVAGCAECEGSVVDVDIVEVDLPKVLRL